jgi:hypothetical protein
MTSERLAKITQSPATFEVGSASRLGGVAINGRPILWRGIFLS